MCKYFLGLHHTLPGLLFFALALCAAQALSGEKQVDDSITRGIFQEITLVPVLSAKSEEASKAKALPKFAAQKLKQYLVDDKESVSSQRESYHKNKKKYASQQPLRAAFFEAMEAAQQAERLPILHMLSREITTPKGKAAILKKQEPVGLAMYQLELVYEQMQKGAEQRDKEPSKRWQAHFDEAMARVLTNILFLYEYNFLLGTIRADALPEIREGQEGWVIISRPKLRVTEPRAKTFAKDRTKLLQKIQNDYPDTPWSFLAERESRRELGLEWVVKK